MAEEKGDLLRSIFTVLMALLILGSPFMGLVLNRTTGMGQPEIFFTCLGLIAFGTALFLLYSRISKSHGFGNFAFYRYGLCGSIL